MQQPNALGVRRVLSFQLALTLVLPVAALFFGTSVALSVLIGAVVCLLANAIFAFWVSRSYRAQEPGLLVMRFYGAEIVKLVLVLGLFGVTFATVEDLHVPALLAAYLAVQLLPAILASFWGVRSTRER